MALQPSTHPSAHAHASHTSQASHTHAAHAASKAKPSLSAEDGEGGGFAAQLLKAQPAADKDVKAVDARPKADAAKKPSEDKSGRDGADAKDGSQEEKDAKAPEGKPPVVDPAALLAAQQPVAPATTSLADKTAATGDHDDFATDPLGALRKAAVRPGKDDGKAALLAGLGAGKQAPATATATATSAGLPGKGAASAGDIAAALAKADGAVKAATDARDSLAALLPQPDPAAVQAGAIGAPANALLDANQGAHPATPTAASQATLAMPPQSPTFGPALGHQIEVWMKGGVQHAEVQLSPHDLGPIRVKIEMDGAQARVQMSADVQSTRDALQQAMPQLSQQLGQVGLSLSGGGVSDQPTFQQSQAQAQANAGGSGQGGRPGHGGTPGANGGGGLEDIAAASAARQVAQRRGLLDTYA
jgi:flagellar hook-length control protein FliK